MQPSAGSQPQTRSALVKSRRDVSGDVRSLYLRLLGANVSRRSLLSLSLGAGSLAPLLAPLSRAVAGFRVNRRRSECSLELGGETLFRIAADMFDGKPRINCESQPHSLKISVEGGRLPGTSVPADLLLKASRNGFGWEGSFSIPGLRFACEFPFDQWLLGNPVARSGVQLEGVFCNSGDYDVSLPSRVDAVLYPTWTLAIDSHSAMILRFESGTVSSTKAQMELLRPDAASIHLMERKAPRTRLWLQGSISDVARVEVENGAVRFLEGEVDAVVELQSGQDSQQVAGYAIERADAFQAGFVTPAPNAEAGAPGFTASRLTLSAICSVWKRAHADLSHSSLWTQFEGADVELVSESGRFDSACDSRSGNFIVSRVLLAMAGVDQAVLVRRGAVLEGGAWMKVASVAREPETDDLRWLGTRFGRPDLPLDAFDLRLSRAADAFQMTVRFRHVQLRLEENFSRFLPLDDSGQKTPLFEFVLPPQHVYEEALYVTEVPGGSAQRGKPFLSDLDIARAVFPGVSETEGLHKVCCARVAGQYEDLCKEAGERLGEPPEAKEVHRAGARFAAPTWFTFEWARDSQRGGIRLDVLDLLNWGRFRECRSPFALPSNCASVEPIAESLRRPESLAEKLNDSVHVSAIQAPYRLALSTIDKVDWRSRGYGDRSASPRTELWSLRAEKVSLRAFWSPDFQRDNFWARNFSHAPSLFRAPLDARDRHEFVALSARFGESAMLGSANVIPNPSKPDIGIFMPQPLQARLVLLSSQGASMKLRGQWAPPAALTSGALTVESWDQTSQLGRDTKVVVEYKGFLFPLGHPATLVKETERRLVRDESLGVVARLVQRFFIRIPEASRQIPLFQQPFDGRGWPFGDITMRAGATPDLDDPQKSQLPELGLGQQAFWPFVAPVGKEKTNLVDFAFEDTANGIKAHAPLIFLDNSVAHTPELMLQVVHHYRNELEQKRRGAASWNDTANYKSRLIDSIGVPEKFIARVDSGKVRFAPQDGPGETSFRVLRFLLDVDIPRPPAFGVRPESICKPDCADALRLPSAKSPDFVLEENAAGEGNEVDVAAALRVRVPFEMRNQPTFYAHLRQALVESGTLSRIANTGRQFALVEIDSHYLRKGFDADNSGEIYLRYVDSGASLQFGEDTGNCGGFVDTTTLMSAVSRKRGSIGGSSLPQPQAPGYRYGKRILVDEAPEYLLSSEDEDPVKMARLGAADPREFFGRSLGGAKLCGVVSFADIIDVVAKAGGARAPRIVEQLEAAIPQEAIRDLVVMARNQLQPIADLPDTPQRIRASIIAVINLLSRAEASTSVSELLALSGPIIKAFEQLRDEVRTVLDNPISLLPPQAADWMEKLEALRAELLRKEGLKRLGDEALPTLLRLLKREALEPVENALKTDPRYLQLRERVANVRSCFVAIENARNADPLILLRVLSAEMLALTEGAVDISAWRTWLDDSRRDLAEALDAYWDTITSWLGSQQHLRSIAAAAEAYRDQAKSVLEAIDARLVAATAVLSESARAQLGQVMAEISELERAATAHSRELALVSQEFANLRPRDPDSIEAFRKASTSVRASLETLAKAKRLVELVRRLAKEPEGVFSPAELGEWVESYAGWLRVAASDVLQKVSGAILSVASKKAAVARDSADKMALEWLAEKADEAQTVASQLGLRMSIGADGNATVLGLPDDLRVLYELVGFLEGAPDPGALAKRAMQQALVGPQELAVEVLLDVATQIAAKLSDIVPAIDAVISQYLASETLQKWVAPSLYSRLVHLRAALHAAAKAPVPGGDPRDALGGVRSYFEGVLPAAALQLRQLLGDLAEVLENGDASQLVKVRGLIDQAIEQLGAPTRATIAYDWETQVHAYPSGAGPIFEPLDEGNLKISSTAVIDLLGKDKPKLKVEAHLDSFKINLFGKASFLSIFFKPLTFTAGTGQEAKLIADVDHVAFGEQLSFIASLQKWLKEKLGIVVEPWSEGPGVVVGYEFFQDIISATAFSLQNVGFGIACILPFNSQPARFRFRLSSPERPFLLSVGIYGGGGHVGIQSRADTIEYLESSFEYGLVTAFRFGVASGTGRITAGIYIRVGSRVCLLSGFFNASGNCDVAGLISVSANFRVQIWYDGRSGKAGGMATFSISFSLGIVDFSYSIPVAYARSGDAQNTNEEKGERKRSERAAVPRLRSLLTGDQAKEPTPGLEAAIESRKSAVAETIPDDGKVDLSGNLLTASSWDLYWDAFEEAFDECA